MALDWAVSAQKGLARGFGPPWHILSVDSVLVYQGLDIGSGKPTREARAAVPHHGIDVCPPNVVFSAGQFAVYASECIANIQAAGARPLLVGGSMLYFHVLKCPLDDLPAADSTCRARIESWAKAEGWAELHRALSHLDREAALRIAVTDHRRIQRALELYELTREKPSSLWARQQARSAEQEKKRSDWTWYALWPKERAVLYDRIGIRWKQMVQRGLEEEVRQLVAQHPDLTLEHPAMRSVGYRQFLRYVLGEIDERTAYEEGLQATRQLAKRQLTWLRSWKGLRFLPVCDGGGLDGNTAG